MWSLWRPLFATEATDQTNSAAELGPRAPDSTEVPAQAEPPPLLQKAEETHQAVSNRLEGIARNIDSFFAADQAFQEATRSYARVRIDTKLDHDFKLGFNGDVRVKLNLPRTERKLKLLLESDNTTARTGAPERFDETPIDVMRRQDYLLSIEHINELQGWDVRPAAGVKLRGIPDPFARLLAIRYNNLDGWLIRASGSAFWFASDGFGANADVNIDRPVLDAMFFRGNTLLGWQGNDQFLTAQQDLSLYHRLDPHRYLVYQVGALANQRPNWAMQYYFAAIHFRRKAYKNWLFVELIPQVDFLVENRFDPRASITFRLEGVFGKDYLE